MNIKHTARLGLAAALVAWSFDQLFWEKPPGISFPIFVLICLGAGAYQTWTEGLRPAPASYLLLVPIMFFAGMSFLRREPFSLLVSYGLALGFLALLSMTWLGGGWWAYNLRDYAANALRWVGSILVKPATSFLSRTRQFPDAPASPEGEVRPPRWRSGQAQAFLSVIGGLALALPVVALLGSLLASADPVFSEQITTLFRLLSLETIGEYLFRAWYIGLGAYAVSGVFLYALTASREERLTRPEVSSLFPPFLGWIPAVTLLICVDLLFIFFVAVQFRYFFGGGANINLAGFTYAEYARRGFAELVVVACLSLLLLLGLSQLAKREGLTAKRVYSALGVVLVGLVAVILVSAFQRLLLYEAAYGFTRLRAYTHVFMIWLGVLLVAVALLEVFGRLRYLALALIAVVLGFGASLALLNVDAFIARQNVARAARGEVLDPAYLVGLSEDADPALFGEFDSPAHSAELHEQLAAALACRREIVTLRLAGNSWPSFHWSENRSLALFRSHAGQLDAYPVDIVDGRLSVELNGEPIPCQGYPSWD